MSKTAWRRGFAIVLVMCSAMSRLLARELIFEDRVKAQEAIERVYYSHQIGAPKPFEEVVPRTILEKKVRTYLKQSAALKKFWSTDTTATMLHRELERMAQGSRVPERLVELYAALSDDPFLIEECLARSALADRLSRNFFAFDERIHREARARAEALHQQLTSGAIDPLVENPQRTTMEVLRDDTGGDAAATGMRGDPVQRRKDSIVLRLRSEEFEPWSEKLDREAGSENAVAEEFDAFSVRVILEKDADRIRVAEYRIAKRSWDDWWSTVSPDLSEASVMPVVQGNERLPLIRSGAGKVLSKGDDPMPVVREEAASGSGSCPADDTWDNGSLAAIPDTGLGFTAVWTGNEMVVWGTRGYLGYGLATAGRYDPATDTWIAASPGIARRWYHTAIWTGSHMIIWGGETADSQAAIGWKYDPATDTWSPISLGPSWRERHTAVWTGNRMIVWGGSNVGRVNTGGQYDPTTDTWTPTSTENAPTERSGHVAVWTGSQMIVWGGTDGIPNHPPLDTGGLYDPSTDTWTPITTLNAPSGRYRHSAVWTGSQMIVWGGTDGYPNYNHPITGGRYDPVEDVWTPISTLSAPSGREEHSALWTGSTMIVWGGSGLDTGGLYDPMADTWSATSTLNAVANGDQAAVWTGSLMLVWRGRSGARYDPLTDTWTPIASAPTRRAGHTAVWTGNEMIVWGGGSGPTDTGGRYDAVTDRWTPTSTLQAPSARGGHTAVWTATEMIVWGGGSNTGGRYNPISDAWTPTSTIDAPSARLGHVAVWTGNRMIVWGGADVYPNYLQSGGRYDPATDTWVATSTTAAPSARAPLASAWTGGLMVVWGGAGDSTGGRYDPSADTWSATSTENAPAYESSIISSVWSGAEMIVVSDGGGYRYNPSPNTWTRTADSPYLGGWGRSAVWTGNRMIIWGGYSGTDQGIRYDPVMDTWEPTSTVNAASPRLYHSAVWTGKWMIVWGGQVSEPTWLGSGGRYAVDPDDDGDGYSTCGGDCDDRRGWVHPAAAEVCDGIDDNCNGQIDEDGLGVDSDGDGIHNACDNCNTTYNADQLDSDYDGIGNACDNCILVVNPAQQNTDADTRGDACDNCPSSYNPFQDDTDADSVGDVCDNCIMVRNADQVDFDYDGEGDACDLNDGLLLFTLVTKSGLKWQDETVYPQFNLYRGSLERFLATSEYTQDSAVEPEAARWCSLLTNQQADNRKPPAGRVNLYLVTGKNGTVESSLGATSDGMTRPNAHPCP